MPTIAEATTWWHPLAEQRVDHQPRFAGVVHLMSALGYEGFVWCCTHLHRTRKAATLCATAHVKRWGEARTWR